MCASRKTSASIARAAPFVAAILGFAACEAAGAENNPPWPTEVSATYSLAFTGFGVLGHFKFQSQVHGSEYTSTGTADVKVPVIYNWSGRLNGGGRLSGEDVHPSSYAFSSQGKPIIGGTKHYSLRLGYKDGAVSQITEVPPNSKGGKDYVPLKPDHLKDAFDPLTAVMAMSRIKTGNPCARRIPIFDGKQRFDLLISGGGQQKVPETQPSGQPAMGYVCKVRYVPIAGHKDNEDHKAMAANTGIEVAIRPVPSAGLMVPYRITVPTKWGTATMLLQRMDISAPGQKQIALVH